MNNQTAHFYNLGLQAFVSGDSSSPILNEEVVAAIQNNEVGDKSTIEIMKAFGKGWTYGNLTDNKWMEAAA